MHSEVSAISPVMVEVKVEVPWERVQKDLDRTFDKIAKTAKVRGFRQGKVPKNVVRQLFGRQVKGEVSASLVEEGLLAAAEKHDLHIVSQPEVTLDGITDGKPLAFTAKCEIRPHVDKVSLENLEVEKASAEVKNEEIDEEVDRLRQQHAEMREPHPLRPSKEGDELTIDYTVDIDGEAKDDMAATDRPVELGSGRLLDAFDEGLRGLKPGDEKEIGVTFEEDHSREDLRGKKATFKVKVKELREKILPELDDEFAKDCGSFETLLELRLDIRKKLEQMAGRRAESELKERVVDKLVELNDVPAPPSMIKSQQIAMLQELGQLFQMVGRPPELSKEMVEGLEKRAERRVKAAILLGALARQEKLEVGDADVDKKLQEIAEQSGKHIAKVRVDYQGERLDQLRSHLLEEKLMDFLVERAKIKDAPAPQDERDGKD